MSTERILLNEVYGLLSEALSLMDVPEQYQDEDWYARREKIQEAVLAFETGAVHSDPPRREPTEGGSV
jgi:hypothetical protein